MNRLVGVPPVSHQALAKVAHVETKLGGDVAHNAAFSTKLYPAIIAFVNRLFSQCRPSAVVGRVRAVVVDTVNAMPWRRLGSHISQERLVALSPAFADGYAAAAIPAIVRIAAPRDNAAPASVFGCVRSVVASSASMLPLGVACTFFLQTPATLGVASAKIISKHCLRLPAIASTQPRTTRWRGVMQGLHHKSAKSLTNQVDITVWHSSSLYFTAKVCGVGSL